MRRFYARTRSRSSRSLSPSAHGSVSVRACLPSRRVGRARCATVLRRQVAAHYAVTSKLTFSTTYWLLRAHDGPYGTTGGRRTPPGDPRPSLPPAHAQPAASAAASAATSHRVVLAHTHSTPAPVLLGLGSSDLSFRGRRRPRRAGAWRRPGRSRPRTWPWSRRPGWPRGAATPGPRRT
jgi:hypothetical protein